MQTIVTKVRSRAERIQELAGEMQRRADRFDKDATLHCMGEIFENIMDSFVLMNDITPGLTSERFMAMLKLMHDKYETMTGVSLPIQEIQVPEATSDDVNDFAVVADKP